VVYNVEGGSASERKKREKEGDKKRKRIQTGIKDEYQGRIRYVEGPR